MLSSPEVWPYAEALGALPAPPMGSPMPPSPDFFERRGFDARFTFGAHLVGRTSPGMTTISESTDGPGEGHFEGLMKKDLARTDPAPTRPPEQPPTLPANLVSARPGPPPEAPPGRPADASERTPEGAPGLGDPNDPDPFRMSWARLKPPLLSTSAPELGGPGLAAPTAAEAAAASAAASALAAVTAGLWPPLGPLPGPLGPLPPMSAYAPPAEQPGYGLWLHSHAFLMEAMEQQVGHDSQKAQRKKTLPKPLPQGKGPLPAGLLLPGQVHKIPTNDEDSPGRLRRKRGNREGKEVEFRRMARGAVVLDVVRPDGPVLTRFWHRFLLERHHETPWCVVRSSSGDRIGQAT
eukprot:g12615.t1